VASPILPEIAFIYINHTEFNNEKQSIDINVIKAWSNQDKFPAGNLNWQIEDEAAEP
jgi:hypothetical protein